MKRYGLAFLALFLTLAPLTAQVNPKEWSTEGIKVNPAANTVLCQYVNETAIAEAHALHFVVVSTISAAVVFEQMDATNTTALRSQILPLLASAPYDSMKVSLTIAASERWRVRTNAIMVGSAQCTLFVE